MFHCVTPCCLVESNVAGRYRSGSASPGSVSFSAEMLRHGCQDCTYQYPRQRWCDQRCIRVIVEGDNRNVLRNAQAELTDCLDDADGDKTVKAQNAVGRFLSYCEGDLRRFRLAEVFLFTSPGIPCVFYGDELGMDGSSETTLRGPMPWEKVQDGEDDFFSRLIAIRKEHEELIYGDYTLRYMDHDGGYIYQRTWGDHKIIVCLNNGSTTIDLREYLGKGSVLLSESYEAGKLGSMGYAIIEEK